MVERIVAQICVALLGWLDKRIERQSTALDADPDADRLRLAGDRLREWMQRGKDGVRPGGISDEGRPVK